MKFLYMILSFSAAIRSSFALPSIDSPSLGSYSLPQKMETLKSIFRDNLNLHRHARQSPEPSTITDPSLETKCENLMLRGGKLDGFAAVIIENLAAAEHFESLLCTSRLAITNAFRSIDRDDSGHISKIELKEALQILGVNATETEVESIFNGLDENKDGGVNFEVNVNELSVNNYSIAVACAQIFHLLSHSKF